MARRGSYAKGIARREEILDSALDVIGRRGYQNASLKDIAEVVGVTPAALLHYFGSKEDLFTAVLRRRDERDEIGAGTDIDTARAAFLATIRHNAEVPGLVELFSRLSVDAVDPEHPAHQYFLERSERLRTAVAEGLAHDPSHQGALDPDTMARVVQAVSDGLQLQWMIDPSVDMAGIVEKLIDALSPRGATD
ncbi:MULTISPECIES: TetR/AcrR family transcriptional regulator [unclassified Microbacterium]|uniref:TetR/AcrR family transcriptional regulator n=1 Tax=unclassified Microbacterium TaxID=2609290 RepID=UPI0012FABA63|nr:TetR/AcrR family transcriptional regulator [Microbacterium sp. MAH-37]MVQ41381.1 TetR family transcriptional regulator [Microbacterium sp. MAH-37]